MLKRMTQSFDLQSENGESCCDSVPSANNSEGCGDQLSGEPITGIRKSKSLAINAFMPLIL